MATISPIPTGAFGGTQGSTKTINPVPAGAFQTVNQSVEQPAQQSASTQPSWEMQNMPSTMKSLNELQTNPLSLQPAPQPTGALGYLKQAFAPTVAIAKNIKNSFVSAYQSLKETKALDVPNPDNAKLFGSFLSTAAKTVGAAISPITAVFQVANDIPVVGTASRLLSLPFNAIGDVTPELVGAAVDKIPNEIMSPHAKEVVKPGLQEIITLAAQLAAGKAVDLAGEKGAELIKEYGAQDASTIIGKAKELAQRETAKAPTESPTEQKTITPVPKEAFSQEAKTPETSNTEGVQPGEWQKYFTDKTTNPRLDKMVEEKAPNVKYQMMSPDDYLKEIDKSGKPLSQVEPLRVEKSKARMLNQGDHALPYLDYSGETFDQEGIHRMTAAKELGVKEVPVLTVDEPTGKVSGVARSIEAKAVEAKLTEKFKDLAEYNPSTIKEQARIFNDVVDNQGVDALREMIRGDRPLADGQKSFPFVVAAEEYLKSHPDADMAYELANSPHVTAASEAGSQLGLGQNREQDSATARLAEVRQAREARSENRTSPETRKAARSVREQTEKVNLPKEDLAWDKFLNEITC